MSTGVFRERSVARARYRPAMPERDPADPPTPVPLHLAPIEAPLGPEDLRIVLTTDELRAVVETCEMLDLDLGYVMLTQRDGSPWVEIAVAETERVARPFDPATATPIRAATKLALWRYTCAVYRLDEFGAVEDDPIFRPDWRRR